MIILSKVRLKCHAFPGWQMLQVLRLVSVNTNISKTGNIPVFNELGFNENESRKLLNINNKCARKRTHTELKKALHTVQRLGFTNQQILHYPHVLSVPSHTINRRFKVLEEVGVRTDKISLQLIKRFRHFTKLTGSNLKKEGIINANIDITRNILSYCDLPIYLYPRATDDSQEFTIIQEHAVKCYISWLLKFTQEEIDKKFKMYRFGYKYRSVRLIKQIYDMLKNDFGFPKEKIRKHMYLLHNSPEQILNIVERVPFIDSKSIIDIAYIYPKVLMRPADTILEILQILKEFNIEEKNASQFPQMFSLAPETVRKRVEMLTTDPQYKYLIHNARMFQCVTNFRRLTNNSSIIKDSKFRCYSTDLLSISQSKFDVRCKLKPDYYNGSDIIHFLKKKTRKTANEIRKVISQHVLWNYVPLNTISSTLEFLHEGGFSENQIFSALPVILYPKVEVEKCLKELDGNQEVDCCRDPSTGKVRSELVLQLVLYYLERPFHFTGNGVWELDPTHTEQAQ